MGKFDGILDDVIVNAKAAASVVSKKASDVYDSSKQKIAAARALIRHPQVLLLDESFSAMDPASRMCAEKVLLECIVSLL